MKYKYFSLDSLIYRQDVDRGTWESAESISGQAIWEEVYPSKNFASSLKEIGYAAAKTIILVSLDDQIYDLKVKLMNLEKSFFAWKDTDFEI